MVDLRIGVVCGKYRLRSMTPKEKQELINLLSNRKSRMRWIAADELGKRKIITAVDPLILALRDSHWMVRLHAAKALGRIGDKKAIGALINCLNDECPYVQRRVIAALGVLKDERAIPYLLEKLQTDKEMRFYINNAFDNLMGSYAAFALTRTDNSKEIYWNPNSTVRNLKKFTPLLLLILSVSTGKIMKKTIKILGKYGDERALPMLEKLYNHSQYNTPLCSSCYGAIGQIICRKFEKYFPEHSSKQLEQ